MQFIKFFILVLIFILSNIIGKMVAGKFRYRLKELQEMKNALSIFKTKIRFTYEPIPEIFDEISTNLHTNIAKIFKKANENMVVQNAGQAWTEAVETSQNYLNKEDKTAIQILGKMLGQSDVEGQISQIEVTEEFLNKQIEDAEKEKIKNEKLYQKLGTILGLTLVTILM
ncbi:MAG: stage III sporulation protein AB [Clostridia bacterium]|nr:stage III sporulation protein AB [Clostridia bacterium]